MPILLGIVSGGLTVAAWYFAAHAIDSGAQAVRDGANAVNGPTLQLAALAGLLYAGAIVLHETRARR